MSEISEELKEIQKRIDEANKLDLAHKTWQKEKLAEINALREVFCESLKNEVKRLFKIK